MNNDDLASKHCEPCRGGIPPLTPAQYEPLLARLNDWRVERGHHLVRTFSFPDFRSALAFVNEIGDLAEREGHHPDVHLAWGRVTVELWTHKIDGLSESDFILAAKIDALAPDESGARPATGS